MTDRPNLLHDDSLTCTSVFTVMTLMTGKLAIKATKKVTHSITDKQYPASTISICNKLNLFKCPCVDYIAECK